MTRTVVVGAGLAGLAVAWALADLAGRRGEDAEVVLLDRAPAPGQGGSGRAVGLFRTAFTHPGNVRLARASRAIYAALLGALGRTDRSGPGLLLASRADPPDPLVEAVARATGAIAAGDGAPRWPARLGPPPRRTVFVPGDGYLSPLDAMNAFWFAGLGAGVRVALGTEVVAVLRSPEGRVTGIQTPAGQLPADAVVLAGGAVLAEQAARAGAMLPVTVQWRPVCLLRPVAGLPPETTPLVVDLDSGLLVLVTPDGVVLGTGGPRGRSAPPPGPAAWLPEAWEEPADPAGGPGGPPFGGPAGSDVGALFELLAEGPQGWPALAGAELAGATTVPHETTPDGLPLVGAVPGAPGLYVAGGWNGYGLSVIPAAAKALAGLVLGAPVADEVAAALDAYAPDRWMRSPPEAGAPAGPSTGPRGSAGEGLIL